MSSFNLHYSSVCSIIYTNKYSDENMQIDKRIIKTRTSIKNAFMELVQTLEISRISVSELAAKAFVNRSTFYLHYTDVQAVATDIESEIAQRIASYIDNFSIDDIYGSTYTLFKKLTNRLDENETLKKYIIFSTSSDYVISKIKEIFAEKTRQSILETFKNVSEKDIKYPLVFTAAGVIDCYVKWVREDNKPLEDLISEVGKITERIITNITQG